MDIKDIIAHLKREWELCVLAAVVLLLVIVGCQLLLQAGDAEEPAVVPGGGSRSSAPSSLSARELGFLESPSSASVMTTGPLGLPSWMRRALRKPVRSRPVPAPAPTPTPVPSVPVPAVAVVPAVVPAPSIRPFKRPAPERLQGTLYFAEYRELSDGSVGGLFELSHGTFRQSLVLRVGERQRGLLLESVSARRAQLRDARGRQVELKSETELRLWYLSK